MTFKSVLAICSLSAALCGISPVAFAADSASAPVRTQIKLLTPFGPAGSSIGMAVTETVNGRCFTGSIASPSRPDAWRCSSGNGILDPCYQRIVGDEKQLACSVGGPWPSKCGDPDVEPAIAVRASQGGEPRKHSAVGARTHQRPASHDVHRRYCAGGEHAHQLRCPGGFQVVGDIDRSQPVWRVFFQGEKSIALEQVDVAVAWF